MSLHLPWWFVAHFPAYIVNELFLEFTIQKNKTVFTTILLSTLEYYIDKKSALTFSFYHNQVYRDMHFWQDGGSAFGLSIGFITSLL